MLRIGKQTGGFTFFSKEIKEYSLNINDPDSAIYPYDSEHSLDINIHISDPERISKFLNYINIDNK